MKVVDNKRQRAKDKVRAACTKCKSEQKICPQCTRREQLIDAMADSNIPVGYWFLPMSKFEGPPNVKKVVELYKSEIGTNYDSGKGLCFTGQYGTGKTYSISSILKHALINGYSAYYTTLLDLGHYMSDFKYSDSFYHTATRCDFLALDEIDSRHFSDSDDAQRFFGSNLERVVRYRTQNKLPILIATNNSNLKEVFVGQYSRVLDSLIAQSLKVVPALGKDFRKKK